MSERLRAPPAHPSPPERELSTEDLRRRLEGRLEHLEAARERYAALRKRLASIEWKWRLLSSPGVLQEVLDQEEALEEAIARTRKRMEAEGWPETLPALEPLREVVRLRTRLGALVRKRLARLCAPVGEPSLKADLASLWSILQAPPVVMPGDEEPRLLKMDPRARAPLVSLILFFLPLLGLVMCFSGHLTDLIVAGLMLVYVAVYFVRGGEFWLTRERLIWKPVESEPVAVSLRSIRPGGIRVDRLLRGVRVEGDRIVHVRHVEPIEKLAALLEMYRQPPLLGVSRRGPRLPQVCICKAALRGGTGARARQGFAVLRPQGVSFVPRGMGLEALQALTGSSPPKGLRVELSWFLEELRWLPEAEFDASLARVVEGTGGVHWSAGEARRAQDVPLWKKLHITCGPQWLIGKLDGSQQEAAEHVFGSWPSPESSNARVIDHEPRRSVRIEKGSTA